MVPALFPPPSRALAGSSTRGGCKRGQESDDATTACRGRRCGHIAGMSGCPAGMMWAVPG